MFVCISYHVRQCFEWGGVEWGKQRSLVLARHEVTFMLLRWSLLGGFPGGWGGTMITLLMFHLHAVTFMLIILLLRSSWSCT